MTEAAAAIGRKLVRARAKAGAVLCQDPRQLLDLGMQHTEVRVAMADEFSTEQLLAVATEHGPVPVDLEVRINPGEPFHSMRDTASGGELARIVLAVKKTLADQDRVPLLVLDEIDAEIGGRLGMQVGRKLHEVAKHHQVVIVTHLAPVAAFAQHHFLVNKEVAGKAGDERTRSSVRPAARRRGREGARRHGDGRRHGRRGTAAGAAPGREGQGHGGGLSLVAPIPCREECQSRRTIRAAGDIQFAQHELYVRHHQHGRLL